MVFILFIVTLILRTTRSTFDTSDTRREFGPIIIDFAKVQSKVSLKYDSWHKETLSKFGALLSNEMATFHTSVSKSRSDLELQSIEAASTSDAVTFITYVQQLKRSMKQWEKQVKSFFNLKKMHLIMVLLFRSRYTEKVKEFSKGNVSNFPPTGFTWRIWKANGALSTK